MNEPDWIAKVEAELARLEAALGPRPSIATGEFRDWVWQFVAQAEEMNAFLQQLGGSVSRMKRADLWACRIGGFRATSTSSWKGAVTNAIAQARKRAAA